MKQPNLNGSGSKAKFVALIKGAIIFSSGILAIQIPITNKHCPSKLFQSLVFGVVDVNDLIFRSVCAFILIYSQIVYHGETGTKMWFLYALNSQLSYLQCDCL